MNRLVHLLTERTPVYEPFGTLIVIVGLFLAAWLLNRVAARVAAWLIGRSDRRRTGDPLRHTGVIASLKQRRTAISLVETSIRYLVFGLAVVLSIAVAVGAKRIDAIVGASFLAIVVAFAAQRFLMDVIAGLLMFFEGWFRVGDAITIDPWKVQGIVEDVSVRSITVRGMDGDLMHVPNSSVMATRVAPRARREVEIEVYTSDLESGLELLEAASRVVPTGPTHFVRRPAVTETEHLDGDLFRITATAAVAPGREWLAEDLFPALLKERAGENLIVHGPVVMPHDEHAASGFAHAVRSGDAPARPERIPIWHRRPRG